MSELIIIGGGLAGCEAAWQAAARGINVTLYEMRPHTTTPAHTTSFLAELVCSNSLGAKDIHHASGLLMEELSKLDSLVLQCAKQTALPAGGALAVDRAAFATLITEKISTHPKIRIVRQEITEIPQQPAVIASGPLTSEHLASSIQTLCGQDNLFFFDAIAPIVSAESINMNIAFKASRYAEDNTAGDYINCPLNKDEYEAFVEALLSAERIRLRDFENEIQTGVKTNSARYFEGCLPIEVLASRGKDALAYGPMRPTGLYNPNTHKRPYAVVQLRQDNLAATLYNMVGFQTNLTYAEQQRVFRTIPALENAEFVRFGQMHRNTFILSPALLLPTLQFRYQPDLFFAGQITGIEGYMGNIATGLIAGINAAHWLLGKPIIPTPPATMIGALLQYITHAETSCFQPMKANFGILPPLDSPIRHKQQRIQQHLQRAQNAMNQYLLTLAEI
ncbi:MAG: methylenetetrahydrofolate--tRNA-(uracil(54)-C(5))-methyltransferase (FADH(2)-oxidizing) TrmFO [Anaerolineae bacterium]|nr:methylenetetrahydrofolate--tRNA-(uracil(54)-C(5))-methyltransferase (FADH(2)-oxidizing) TrmFO [Anaerolineae bacterium]